MASGSYLYKIATVDTYFWEKAKIRTVVDKKIIITLLVIVKILKKKTRWFPAFPVSSCNPQE